MGRTEPDGEPEAVSLPPPLRQDLLAQLRSLGLSAYEAAAYATLLTRPEAAASTVCEEAGIPDSKVYLALSALQKRGMVTAQEGTPRRYKALHPKEALVNLKRQLAEEFEERTRRISSTLERLAPLYERASGAEDVELAYVVKGFRNIVNRMNRLVEESTREVTAFIPNETVYKSLEDALLQAKRRGVRVRVAATPELLDAKRVERFGDERRLSPGCSSCWMLISDRRVLLTVSDWESERCSGILTQDPNLITVTSQYFENPKCCVSLRYRRGSAHTPRCPGF